MSYIGGCCVLLGRVQRARTSQVNANSVYMSSTDHRASVHVSL